jgi:hypothetical protein
MTQLSTSRARASTSMIAIAGSALVICSLVVSACAASPGRDALAAPAAPAVPAAPAAVGVIPAAPVVPAARAGGTPVRDRLDSEYLRSIATGW